MRKVNVEKIIRVCTYLTLILILLLVINVVAVSNIKSEAKRFESYGYLVECEHGKKPSDYIYACYVIMEDNTRVLVKDFDISDYKKPMQKRRPK